jgi:membrane protein required for beta-lactamase induction
MTEGLSKVYILLWLIQGIHFAIMKKALNLDLVAQNRGMTNLVAKVMSYVAEQRRDLWGIRSNPGCIFVMVKEEGVDSQGRI